MNTQWILCLPESQRKQVIREIRDLEDERDALLLRVAEQEAELRKQSEAALILGSTIRTASTEFEYKASISFSKIAWYSQPAKFKEDMIRSLAHRVVQHIAHELEVDRPLNALVGKQVRVRRLPGKLAGQMEGQLTFDTTTAQYYVGELHFFQVYFSAQQVESIKDDIITLKPN